MTLIIPHANGWHLDSGTCRIVRSFVRHKCLSFTRGVFALHQTTGILWFWTTRRKDTLNCWNLKKIPSSRIRSEGERRWRQRYSTTTYCISAFGPDGHGTWICQPGHAMQQCDEGAKCSFCKRTQHDVGWHINLPLANAKHNIQCTAAQCKNSCLVRIGTWWHELRRQQIEMKANNTMQPNENFILGHLCCGRAGASNCSVRETFMIHCCFSFHSNGPSFILDSSHCSLHTSFGIG